MVAGTNRFFLALLLLLGGARVVHAGESIPIAVLQFVGPGAKVAEAVVYRALKPRATFIPFRKWAETAKRNFATSLSPDDVAVVAREVHAKIVISGNMKRIKGKWVLRVNTRVGETGALADQVKYELKTPKLTPKVSEELFNEINESLDTALKAAAATTPDKPAKPPVAATDNGSANNSANNNAQNPGYRDPFAPPPPPPPPSPDSWTVPGHRPLWAPYFDIDVGFVIQSRNFIFNDNTGQFSGGAGAGVRVDATVFPLASTYKMAGGILAGLGLGLTLDAPFWPASVDKDMSGNPIQYPTTELRVEGGLRWWFILSKRHPQPQLLVGVGGGRHSFDINRGTSQTYAGPPDIVYTYLSATVGFRLRPVKRLRLALTNDVLISTSVGPMSSADNYGATSLVIGFRPKLKIEVFVWRGLKVGADAFYERTLIKLATDGMGARRDAGIPSTAVDQYYGGTVFIGYVF